MQKSLKNCDCSVDVFSGLSLQCAGEFVLLVSFFSEICFMMRPESFISSYRFAQDSYRANVDFERGSCYDGCDMDSTATMTGNAF